MKGQSVQQVKPNVWRDVLSSDATLSAMAKQTPKPPTPAQFTRSMCRRLQQARDDSGKSQKDMAELLGLNVSTYAKYENRSAMPPYLIPRVCAILGMDAWFLLTGTFHQNSAGLPLKEESSSRSHGSR